MKYSVAWNWGLFKFFVEKRWTLYRIREHWRRWKENQENKAIKSILIGWSLYLIGTNFEGLFKLHTLWNMTTFEMTHISTSSHIYSVCFWKNTMHNLYIGNISDKEIITSKAMVTSSSRLKSNIPSSILQFKPASPNKW